MTRFFDNFWRVHLGFSEILYLLNLAKNDAIGQIFTVVNDQNIENNLGSGHTGYYVTVDISPTFKIY